MACKYIIEKLAKKSNNNVLAIFNCFISKI